MSIDETSRLTPVNKGLQYTSRSEVSFAQHIDKIVDLVRVGIKNTQHSNSREDHSGRTSSDTIDQELGNVHDSAYKGISATKGSRDSADGEASSKQDDPYSMGLEKTNHASNVTQQSTRLVEQNRALTPQLETLVQMLMALFGSGHVSENDKNKIIAFIRELMNLSGKSTDTDLKEALHYILNKGLEKLRADRDVTADDIANLEKVIVSQ